MSVKMVDIGQKEPIDREAIASGTIALSPGTVDRIRTNSLEKGDVLAVARVAAIQAVKHTPDLIPLCHPIPIEHVAVEFAVGSSDVKVIVRVRAHARTGVEMEALAGAAAALLTLWDMTKKYEKDGSGQYPSTSIRDIQVLEKRKGSGCGKEPKGGETGSRAEAPQPERGASDEGV